MWKGWNLAGGIICNYLIKSCKLKCCKLAANCGNLAYDFKPILPKVNKKM